MNLYLISQDENNDWDTFDSAVVCAESEEAAMNIHPDGRSELLDKGGWGEGWVGRTWCERPDQVTVKRIGIAEPGIAAGVVCASFNAG